MKTRKMKLGVVAHDGGSNTQEAEAGLLAWGLVWDPVEEGELHTSLGIPGRALCTAHSAVNGQT